MFELLTCLSFIGFALTADSNLVELATNLGATTLATYLNDTRLKDTLSTGGPFTVLGPTNAAFAALPASVKGALSKDPALLEKVLMYHVANGAAYSSQLTNNMLVPSLDIGDDIRVNIYTKPAMTFLLSSGADIKVITASGSQVVLPDQNASNGVIHVVDRVMYPLPEFKIPEYLVKTSELSTLLYVVLQTGLTTAVNADGPLTFFAPNNAAFDKLPTGALSDLLSDIPKLQEVLKYHVVSGTFYSKGMKSGSAPTLAGKNVTITVGDGVSVNGAMVITADQSVRNGVVHIIDSVLLPS